VINDDMFKVNPHYRYETANFYFTSMRNAQWMKPEFLEANAHKLEIELHILNHGYLPESIDAYCQAIARAWLIYLEENNEHYWKNDLDGLSGITKLC